MRASRPRPFRHLPTRCAVPLLAGLAALPALAQQGGTQPAGSGPRAERELPQAAAEPLGPCQLNANLLFIMIGPESVSMPLLVRPFTSKGEAPEELVALRDRCAAGGWRRDLVDWTGAGPGVRPRGEDSEPLIEKQPARPDLDRRPGDDLR